MMASSVLMTSLVLQFVALYFVLRLIKLTGKSLAWSFIAAAVALMALRSGVSLGKMYTSGFAEQPDLSVELISLAISALMAIGIQRAIPLFTNLRSVADRLKESETRYRVMFENSPISIWEEDFSGVKALLDGLREQGVTDIEEYFGRHPEVVRQCADLVRIVDVNRAAQLLHRAASKEGVLGGLANTFTPASFDTFRRELACLWDGGTEMDQEAMVKTLAGDPRHVTVYFAVCPGYEETLSRVFVSLIDITEPKRVEQELKLRELEYHTLVDNLPDSIARFDAGCRYLFVNSAAARTFGVPREEFLGKSLSEIGIPGDEAQNRALEQSIRQVFEKGKVAKIEAHWETRNGPRVYEILHVPERDEQGEVARVLGIAHDITERKQAERERQGHMDFLASMDRINRTIQGANDLETMMGNVLDEVLAMFDCDRAFLLYPCDPDAASWTTPMERARPEYPGVGAQGVDIPMDPQVAESLKLLLANRGVLKFGPGTEHLLPEEVSRRFGFKSLMATALYPKVGKAWEFGVHQCSYDRIWTSEEERLLLEIGRRMTDGLNGLLVLRELQESEAKYRRFVDTASEGIWALGADLRTSFVNAQMAGLLGYSSEEMLGRPFTDFMYEEDIADHMQRMERRRRNILEHYERRFRRKDGTELWTWVSAAAISGDKGEFQGSFAMLTDITERKRAEERLKASEARFRLTLESAQMGVWDWDVKADRYYASPGYYTMLGYEPREGLADRQEWVERLHPDDRAMVQEKVHRVLSRLCDDYSYDARMRHADGSYRWQRMIGYGIERDASGKVTRMLGLRMDIDTQKRAEEVLRRYREQLEETVEQRTAELRLARDAAEAASKAKSLFLANMSHELRTPLNAILGFSNMMRQDPGLSPAQHENLDIINHSGEHLLGLINDVLEIAKIESGKLQLEIAPFDLGAMAREVGRLMQLRARQKGLHLVLDQSQRLPRYIKGDEARLRQILVNLVGNAVKFTSQGGVTIRLDVGDDEGRQLRIEVEDSGSGIKPEDQKRLFLPFVQVAEGATKGGTGLGLSIARQFVQLMGGKIGVESTPGKGTLFRVELPLVRADEAEIAGQGGERQGEVTGLAPGQPVYRILIAEDQYENRLLLTTLMTDLGLEVQAVKNGEECIRVFKEWHPDLIWMDRRMPVMDGVEATRRIRRLRGGKKVKIVAVTASAFKEQQPELLEAGMDDYVRKPYHFGEIYESLARQLGLEYLYKSEQAGKTKPALLTPAMLAGLGEEVRGTLREALLSLDRGRIAAVIRLIGDRDPALAQSLTSLSDNFDYPAILQALDASATHEEDKG